MTASVAPRSVLGASRKMFLTTAKAMIPKMAAAALPASFPTTVLSSQISKSTPNRTFGAWSATPTTTTTGICHRSSVAVAATGMTDEQIHKLFRLWADALETLDADTVANRYAKDSILLPTLSNTPRTDHDSIRDYFVDFLKNKPHGQLLESKVIKGDNWALDAGIYEFTMEATGEKVKARFTYLYQYEDGEWKISHHHSSLMPEAG